MGHWPQVAKVSQYPPQKQYLSDEEAAFDRLEECVVESGQGADGQTMVGYEEVSKQRAQGMEEPERCRWETR